MYNEKNQSKNKYHKFHQELRHRQIKVIMADRRSKHFEFSIIRQLKYQNWKNNFIDDDHGGVVIHPYSLTSKKQISQKILSLNNQIIEEARVTLHLILQTMQIMPNQPYKNDSITREWINLGIINKLQQFFKNSNSTFQLLYSSTLIINQLLISISQNFRHTENLISIQFVKSLPHFLNPKHKIYDSINLKQASLLIQALICLVSIILQTMPYKTETLMQNQIIHSLQILADYNLIQNNNDNPQLGEQYQILFMSLFTFYKLLKNSQKMKNNQATYSIYQTVITKILNYGIYRSRNNNVKRICLKILSQAALCQEQAFLSIMFADQQLIQHLISCISNQHVDSFTRLAVSNILVCISSTFNETVIHDLIFQHKILYHIKKGLKITLNQQQTAVNLLKIVSNIVNSSNQFADEVLSNQVFLDIIDQCQNFNKATSCISVYVLCSYFNQNNHVLLKKVIHKLNNQFNTQVLLKILLGFLTSPYICNDIQIIIQVLAALDLYIEFYQQLNQGKCRQQFISHLQCVYDIQNILNSIQKKLENNKIQSLVNRLLQKFYGNFDQIKI